MPKTIKKPKMSICFVSPSRNNIYINIFKNFKNYQDINFTFLSHHIDRKHTQIIKHDDIKFVYHSSLVVKNKIIQKIIGFLSKFTSIWPELNQTLNSIKPDIIIINNYFRPSSIQAVRYATKNNIPFVLMTEVQDFYGPLMKIAYKISFLFLKNLMFNKAAMILPWTERSRKFIIEHVRPEHSRIKTLSPGIDPKIFYPVNVKKDADILNIVMVARMIPYKRYKDALKAAKLLKERGVKFRLTFRGEGPLEDKIRALVRSYGLSGQVVFLDRIPYTKMNELFCANDVFILPSHNEAVGMVAPESMACGVVPVVSDSSGAEMYIKDGENGYIFKTFDYRDLARKIELLMDPKRRKRLSHNALNSIKNNHTDTKAAAKLYSIIKKL